MIRRKPSIVALMLAIILLPIVLALRWDRVKKWSQPDRLTPEVLMNFGDIEMELDSETGMPHGVTRVHANPDDPQDFGDLHCVMSWDNAPIETLAVSTVAVPQMEESPRVFPVGTLIYRSYRSETKKRSVVIAMRKREPGFDPGHNDWSYLYGESNQPYEVGRVEKCIACHSSAAADDYVFNHMKPD